MPFNSFSYFLFLLVVFFIFCATRDNVRWLVLLAASYLFYYSFNAPYLVVILSTISLFTYSIGICLTEIKSEAFKRAIYLAGITLNVVVLLALKYFPIFSSLCNFKNPCKTLIIIGVSYFVFQAISYLTDVYYEYLEPERHFGFFALYMAFFPKILQGPIERGEKLLPQLRKPYRFDNSNMIKAVFFLTFGLFKKVVIADRLSLYVDPVFNNVHNYSGVVFILVTYLFALQIYFDFSGYTDMAIGTALFFNIELTQNFDSPYLSKSVAEFWRRWHITFSSWILDYVFRPLQILLRDYRGYGTTAALLVTFFVSGVWHGSTYNFIIWGLLHGFYMSASLFWKPFERRLVKNLGIANSQYLKAAQVFLTFNLICLSWVFFRANSLKDSLFIIKKLFGGTSGVVPLLLSQGHLELIILLGVLALTPLFKAKTRMYEVLSTDNVYLPIVYSVIVLLIIMCGVFEDVSFIYFRF